MAQETFVENVAKGRGGFLGEASHTSQRQRDTAWVRWNQGASALNSADQICYTRSSRPALACLPPARHQLWAALTVPKLTGPI
jgi:hypothetical protein